MLGSPRSVPRSRLSISSWQWQWCWSGLDENCASEHDPIQLYGLSPAESRLAVLARGKKLSNIAGDIGVQITTLRTQLSAILRKFDVDRQSDIIRVVSNISASRGAPDPDAREEAEPAGMGDGCLNGPAQAS